MIPELFSELTDEQRGAVEGPREYLEQVGWLHVGEQALAPDATTKRIAFEAVKATHVLVQVASNYGADRVKILNAYYLPDGGNKALYPTITPVNTFRVIFNTYFGGNYELLPDVSRYSQNKVLYEAPSTCVGKASSRN